MVCRSRRPIFCVVCHTPHHHITVTAPNSAVCPLLVRLGTRSRRTSRAHTARAAAAGSAAAGRRGRRGEGGGRGRRARCGGCGAGRRRTADALMCRLVVGRPRRAGNLFFTFSSLISRACPTYLSLDTIRLFLRGYTGRGQCAGPHLSRPALRSPASREQAQMHQLRLSPLLPEEPPLYERSTSSSGVSCVERWYACDIALPLERFEPRHA